MAYCTIDQLTERYGAVMLTQLSDRAELAPGGPSIDAALFERAIADADALIDGYLFGRYQLPLAQVPTLLVDLSQRVAIYFAHGQVASDKIRKDYEDAVKTLERIAANTIRLQVDGVEPASSGQDGEVLLTQTDRPMTVDSMKGYI
tara:strand:+ start:28019 stop:28456 length:438 start_codon:yes stop_codon:yes gene_type:complete